LSKVGIYGGTFDPIHSGHLHVIIELIERKIVDFLLVIPAGQPLLRSSAPVASGAHRLQMCQLAIATLPPEIANKVEVNPIEILRDGPSYAIDSVEAVKQSHPEDQIYLILGADAYLNFNQWHRASELKEMVEIIVIDRPGYSRGGMDICAIDVSATDIRKGVSDLIPESVATFIRQNGLYASK